MHLRSLLFVFLVLTANATVGHAQDRAPALEIQFHRAEAAWKTGASLHEAKARVDRVLEELPNDAEARKLRAQVLLALGRPSDALVDGLRAVELRPSDPEARLVLCEIAIEVEEMTLAGRELDAAAELIVDNPELNLRLSASSVRLGQLERAEAFARTALNVAPRNPHAHYQLARVFLLRGRTDEAAAVLERGFRSATLDAVVVREDEVLRRLSSHSDLRVYLSPR